MKRSIAFIMALVIMFSFVSCGKEKVEIKCSNCGEIISEGDAFCASCGVSLEDIDNENSSTEETTTQTTTTHTHSYTETVTPPTCTQKGYTTFTCECGDSYKDDYVNAKHSYVKYVCTSCNAVDKSHAYEYLTEWVKENGSRRSGQIYVSLVSGDGAHEIVYDTTYDFLYMRIKTSNDLLLLDLSDENKIFNYSYDYKNYSANGSINAKTFTSETTISCDEYSGYSGDKSSILRMAALKIEIAIILLDTLFTLEEMGITYQDLGFEIYEK